MRGCELPAYDYTLLNAWKWALSLNDRERTAVVDTQEQRAREFTWSRTVREYTAFWKWVVRRDGSTFEGGRHGGSR